VTVLPPAPSVRRDVKPVASFLPAIPEGNSRLVLTFFRIYWLRRILRKFFLLIRWKKKADPFTFLLLSEQQRRLLNLRWLPSSGLPA
jgi:hypothetical protein